MKQRVRLLAFLWLTAWFALTPQLTFAQHASPHYKIEESQFGAGGLQDATSSHYKAQQSAGDLAVGSMSSANYDGFGGFLSQNSIFLEMVVQNVSLDFGTLDPNNYSSGAAQGGACSCSFYVRTYLSSGYGVYTISPGPTNESGGILDPKTTLGAPSSSPSVEEFGINLVDNATPDMGANSVNQPDNSFADGKVSTGYDTPDEFKYVPGDKIAESAATATNPAIGETDYTISYIMKPNNITAAGVYKLQHDIVAVAEY